MSNTSKILMAAVAVMVVFAFVSAVSATPGDSASDPIDVLYIGWSWTYGSMSGHSMGDPVDTPTLVSNLTTDTANRSKTFDFSVTKPNSQTVYYRQHYIDLDTWNYYTNNSVPTYATNAVNAQNYDLLIVDMFYSSVMNAREPAFYNATVNASNNAGITTISLNSADYMTGTSYAPSAFDFRDNFNQSTNTTISRAWRNALNASGADAVNTDFENNYLVTLENL